MRTANERTRRLGRLGAYAAGALVLLCSTGPAGGQRGRVVYYQVTYADGTTRDLSAVPTTRQNIRRVVRVLREEDGQKGAEILSTGPQVLTYVNRGQTYRSDLRWSGSAWVAPEDTRRPAPPKPAPAAPMTTPAARPAAPAETQTDVRHAQVELVALSQTLLATHQKLTALERSLKAPAGDAPNRPAPAEQVAAARQAVREALLAVIETARKLSPAPSADAKAPPASGNVSDATSRPAGAAAGIARPIDDVAVLPYRRQVWKLPPATSERTCTVSIAHPEAGAFGEFYYVAYADTTGDGRPDKLIARSPAARARRAGQWTQWAFTTAERDVFVGKAWSRPNASHYHSTAITVRDHWRGLSQQAYVAANLWGHRGWHRLGAPCLANVRVWVGGRGNREWGRGNRE